MLQVLTCPACSGQLTFEPGQRTTTCEFCGAQVTRDGELAERSPVLTRAISLKVLPEMAIVLMRAGTALPASITETIGSQSDDQRSIHVILQTGSDSDPANNGDLVSVTYALRNSRDRGMPVAQMKLSVDALGAVTLELREEGTNNTRCYDGIKVPVESN